MHETNTALLDILVDNSDILKVYWIFLVNMTENIIHCIKMELKVVLYKSFYL